MITQTELARVRALARLAAFAALMALMVALANAAGLIRIDYSYGAYGVSIGTETHYCSAEYITDPHIASLQFTCQAGD